MQTVDGTFVYRASDTLLAVREDEGRLSILERDDGKDLKFAVAEANISLC